MPGGSAEKSAGESRSKARARRRRDAAHTAVLKVIEADMRSQIMLATERILEGIDCLRAEFLLGSNRAATAVALPPDGAAAAAEATRLPAAGDYMEIEEAQKVEHKEPHMPDREVSVAATPMANGREDIPQEASRRVEETSELVSVQYTVEQDGKEVAARGYHKQEEPMEKRESNIEKPRRSKGSGGGSSTLRGKVQAPE